MVRQGGDGSSAGFWYCDRAMTTPAITIENRFHGPKDSGNGGYSCGSVAAFIDGPARVRLRVPPPLDVAMDVHRTPEGVRIVHRETLIAEAWPAPPLNLEVPPPPTFSEAREASTRYSGFRSHRYPTCFVCGVDREPADGLRLFAGPVAGREIVACPWIPHRSLSNDGETIPPVFVWSALDCPGGFSFPHPESGTILLGELSVELMAPLKAGQPVVIMGWEFRRDGRKHSTGTAIFSEAGVCHGIGRGIWFEVPESPASS